MAKKNKVYALELRYKRTQLGNPRKVGVFLKKDNKGKLYVDKIKTYAYEALKSIGKKLYKDNTDIEEIYMPVQPSMNYREIEKLSKKFNN